MDLSTLPTPVSDYDQQRTGACFTVRSANSPSYSLTRRPGFRKQRSFAEEERKGTEEDGKRARYREYTGINGTTKEEEETSGYIISTKLTQNGTGDKTMAEIGTDGSRKCYPASERQGRTDWRRYNMPSRSKSLDWRAGTSTTDRGKLADVFVLSTKQGLDERRTGVEGKRGRVMSSIQAYNSASTSNVHERSPVSQVGQTLDRGNSLPTRLRSLSGPGSGLKGTASSYGPKGGQTIIERIEKLYGSAGFGKTEDCSKMRDFSTTPVPSHHRETTADVLISPQQRSYERSSGGTFPRRFSSQERCSLSPVQSRKSFTGTQKHTLDSETLLSQGAVRTRDRSGVQWQGPIQGKYSEVGGVNGGRGLEEMGTQSLDRARSRYSVAAQIRSARQAATGLTGPPQSNTFLEEERSLSLRDLSGLLKKQTTDDGSKENMELKSSQTDDVFDSNPQKNTMKSIERRKFPDKLLAASAASVRNKINQFEALTQRVQGISTGQVLMPRRAFSVPMQLDEPHDRVKRSGSAKAIGGLRYRWEGLKEGGKAAEETTEKVTEAGKDLGSNRSLDEVGLRLGRKEREGNVLVENEQKEMGRGNNYAEDLGKYSTVRSTLEISLNGGGQRPGRNFYIDETDFHKISSPAEARESPSWLTSDSSDTSADLQKTTPPRVTSPVSDEDKTPTNSPNNSPLLLPNTKPENAIPIADSENESTSILTEAAKIPVRHSPGLPHPLATSSISNLPDLFSPDANTAHPNGKKQLLDLDAWVAGLSPTIKVWNDDEDDYEDDDDTQRDDDSNYDSDSGESSVTITSNMSQIDHKSFCVSLSDLCNFAGVDYESENDSDEWQSASHRTASLSSDMSALSCVSVMPSEELDRLLEDVRGMGDSALQDYNDVKVVVLHKDVGVGLGFSVAGGVDQNKPVTVHKVFHSGVAAQEGSIREGDQVLSINGTALCGFVHWEALRVLRRAKTREMGVVVLRRGGISNVCKGEAHTNSQGPTQTQVTETGQLFCVRLEKNSRDLGFSLEGGVDSNRGNRPLTVQKIFQGGPVDKVCPGDQVEEIEGMSVVGMRRLEAWTLIRRLPPGPVDVVLRRPVKRLET